MTYTRVTPTTYDIPIEPAVLSVYLKAPTDGTVADQAVYIPWKNCKLMFAYIVTTVAEGNKGAVEVDLELNAASGTEIFSLQVAQNAAIGDIDETTLDGYTTESAARNLNSDASDRDAINVEVDGANTTTWEGNLFMYFERDHI
jgi:hypothetical protein